MPGASGAGGTSVSPDADIAQWMGVSRELRLGHSGSTGSVSTASNGPLSQGAHRTSGQRLLLLSLRWGGGGSCAPSPLFPWFVGAVVSRARVFRGVCQCECVRVNVCLSVCLGDTAAAPATCGVCQCECVRVNVCLSVCVCSCPGNAGRSEPRACVDVSGCKAWCRVRMHPSLLALSVSSKMFASIMFASVRASTALGIAPLGSPSVSSVQIVGFLVRTCSRWLTPRRTGRVSRRPLRPPPLPSLRMKALAWCTHRCTPRSRKVALRASPRLNASRLRVTGAHQGRGGGL